MNTADLITAFFNNEMSPDQERQFLLSVASSDSMRLGLKSHVMLDKLLQEQADLTTVPPMVRTTILREAAVIAAAAASGLAVSEAEAAMSDVEPVASPTVTAPRPSLLARIPRWTAYPMSLLLAAGSFFAGFYAGDREAGAANVLESTPTFDLNDQNVTLPSDDALGQDNASVTDEQQASPGDVEPTMSTTGTKEPAALSRHLDGGREADARTPRSPSTVPAEPVVTSNASSLSSADSLKARDPNAALFSPTTIVRKNGQDSTKK